MLVAVVRFSSHFNFCMVLAICPKGILVDETFYTGNDGQVPEMLWYQTAGHEK